MMSECSKRNLNLSECSKRNLNPQAAPALVLNVNVAVDVPDLFDVRRCPPTVTVNSSSKAAGFVEKADRTRQRRSRSHTRTARLRSPSRPLSCAFVLSESPPKHPAASAINMARNIDMSQLSLRSRENSPSKNVRTAMSPSASQVKFGQILKQQDQENPYKARFQAASQYCLNKDDFSTDSLKDIFALPDAFLDDDHDVSTANTYRSTSKAPDAFLDDDHDVSTAITYRSTSQAPVHRRFSMDSLRELAHVPSISNINSRTGLQCLTPLQHAQTPSEPPSVGSMLFPRVYTLEPMPTGMVSPDFSSADLGKLIPLIAKPVVPEDSSGQDQSGIASGEKQPYFVVFYDPTKRDPTGPSTTKMSNDPFSD